MKTAARRSLAFLLALATGCGGAAPQTGTTVETIDMEEEVVTVERPARPREAPPDSAPPRDVRMPTITRAALANRLELNTVATEGLPVAHIRLVIKSGSATDPANLIGLSHLVASMLKEGTRTKSSAQLAEEIDFLGASMEVTSDEESVTIQFRALSDQLDQALAIVADMALNPAFAESELTKLKTRETDRLELQSKDPNFLARRTFAQAVYGTHPYGRVDTTKEVVERVRRTDLVNWHRQHFVPSNAFLVVVGDVTPARVQQASERVFARWRGGTAPEPQYPAPPAASARRVLLVDRQESVQSVILVGGLAIPRNSPDYVPLAVANQVLGGSAASRLFMDLRERRSLTYGAYSFVDPGVQTGSFAAFASVRNQVTAQAMDAFMEHLGRISAEAPPAEELAAAERYLSDSFPLRIDTPSKIADLVLDLRMFGLGDDYWDTYRTQIRSVTSEQALAAAQHYIRANESVIVVVGRADAPASADENGPKLSEALRRWGAVTVLNTDGVVQATFPAADAEPEPLRQ